MAATTARSRPNRIPASQVRSLDTFLTATKESHQIEQVFVIRTSSSSKANFEAMFNAGVALRHAEAEPDVEALRQVGHQIVLDEGAADRRRLGAMELRRGSVAGASGVGLLGWLIPIGKTLFVLYLQTARKADLPGPTPDQSRNIFTEALCATIRTLKPKRLYAPLLSRLVRNTDFGMQLLRTLRANDVEVYVEGRRFSINGSEGHLLSLISTYFAATDADTTVARLAGVEANIYADGGFYSTTRYLPFTWRSRVTVRTNALTGETERHVPDIRDIEVVPNSVELFDTFVDMLTDPRYDLRTIGIELGKAGVRSRAPRDFADPPYLHELRQPGHAVSNLISDRWLHAWMTGVYETAVRLKADLTETHPGLLDRISEREDGSTWMDVRVPLPMPARGHWLTTEAYERILAVRKEMTPQRIGRAASGGERRPLSSLAQWDEGHQQFRLGTFDSGATYTLLARPLADAYIGGHAVGWPPEQQRAGKRASINAAVLHRSVATELLRLDCDLDSQVASLAVVGSEDGAASPQSAAKAAVALAQEQVDRVQARVHGIRQLRQEALGFGDAHEAEILKSEQQQATADADAAQSALSAAEATLADAAGTGPPIIDDVETATADLGSLSVIAVLLERAENRAPAALNDALARLLGTSLRVHASRDGLRLSWEAVVTVPLLDGRLASAPIGSANLPGVAFQTRTEGGAHPHVWIDDYAKAVLADGRDLSTYARSRGIQASGKSDTWLVKGLRGWLMDHGIQEALTGAALDAPVEVRAVLYRLATGEQPRNAYERHMWTVYTRGPGTRWTFTWACSTHEDARRVQDAVEQIGPAGAPLTAVVEMAGVNRERVRGLCRARLASSDGRIKPPRHGQPKAVALLNCVGSGAGARMAVIKCPHCSGIVSQLLVPELEHSGGLICRDCLRTPQDARVVYPAVYRQCWVGGGRRRQVVAEDGSELWVGTHLAGDVALVPKNHPSAPNAGQRTVTKADRAKARRMLAQGVSLRRVARDLGYPTKTLRRNLAGGDDQ